MDASRRDTLLRLAKEVKPGSLVLALDTLGSEEVDEDYVDVLAAILSTLEDHPHFASGDDARELRPRLRRAVDRIGLPSFAKLVLGAQDRRPELLDVLLPHLSPDTIDELPDEIRGRLRETASRPDLNATTADWFESVAYASENDPGIYLRPTLRGVAESDVDSNQENANVDALAARLVSNEALLTSVTHDVLGSASYDRTVVLGLFRVLAIRPEGIDPDLVGPYVEDAGVWMQISRAIFTVDRVRGLTAASERTGLSDSLRASFANGATSVEQLVADPRFHGGIARMVGSRSAVFALGRLFVDRQVVAALRSIVSDLDAPVRRAAIEALAASGSDRAVPYLLTGALDRDKRARAAAKAALKDLVGEEAYQRYMEEMQAEVSWLRSQLHGLGDWGRKALSSIETALSEAGASAKNAPSRILGVAQRLLGKKEA